MKKRILAILLAIATLATMAFGCKVEEENPNAEFENRPINVKFGFYYAGYGDAHYYAMARDFMEMEGNEEIYWELVDYDDSANMRQHVAAGTHGTDIVQLSVDMFGETQHLEELSAVYDMTALGESVKIKDKGIEYFNYHAEKYLDANNQPQIGYFQMPSGRNGGYNFAYNKTTLDEIFPDGYTLPRTTDEFFKFGKDMFLNGGEDGAYLTSAAMGGQVGGDYFEYIYQTWFAQLMGATAYDKFYEGKYYAPTDPNADADGYVFNDIVKDADNKIILNLHETYKGQIMDAYEVINTLFKKSNNYIHPSSPDLDYLRNDKVFAGVGDGLNFEKTGFIAIGSYLETELKPLIDDGIVNPDNVYGMMRVPVASALVKYLSFRDGENYMSDATLSAIIEAIDNGATYETVKTAVTGIDALTEADFDRIKEARKMVTAQICSNIVVPKISAANEGKRDAIYKILRYLASDRAQKVCANAIGGLNMLAFGAEPALEDLTITPSKFMQDCNAIASDSVTIDYAHVNKIFRDHVTVKWYQLPVTGRLASYVYDTAIPQTAEQMYNALLSNQKGTWESHVNAYKTAVGLN